MPDGLIEQYRKNYEYEYWANDLFVKALSEMENPPDKAVQLMGHILFALDVWLARLKKEDLSRFTDPNPPTALAECRPKLEELKGKWRAYLTGLEPVKLSEKLVYANTQGKRTEVIAQNVLTHVVNHSHYHRGQLATLIHQGGGKRPTTDYIFYTFGIGESKAL